MQKLESGRQMITPDKVRACRPAPVAGGVSNPNGGAVSVKHKTSNHCNIDRHHNTGRHEDF
jgi:hypothetical protein